MLTSKSAVLTLSLICPGAGFAAIKDYKSAILVPTLMFLVIYIPSMLRWVLTAKGLFAVVALLFIIHVFFSGLNARDTQRTHAFLPAVLHMLIVYALVFVLYLNKSALLGLNVYQVTNHSMEPTLNPGDIVLADTWAFKNQSPIRNDLVLFKHKGSDALYIKRIVGLPGDILEIGTNRVTRYTPINHIDSRSRRVTVDAGQFFVLGDHYARSWDSRHFGGVAASMLIGRVTDVLPWRSSSPETQAKSFDADGKLTDSNPASNLP